MARVFETYLSKTGASNFPNGSTRNKFLFREKKSSVTSSEYLDSRVDDDEDDIVSSILEKKRKKQSQVLAVKESSDGEPVLKQPRHCGLFLMTVDGLLNSAHPASKTSKQR